MSDEFTKHGFYYAEEVDNIVNKNRLKYFLVGFILGTVCTYGALVGVGLYLGL